MLKKFFASVIAILLVISVFPFAVFAESTEVKSGTTGDCTWTLNGTVLTISGDGKMEDYGNSNEAPWGKNITEVFINNGVTNIGNYAFKNCIELENIEIPDSVASIGDFAFIFCSGLTSITIPNGVTNIGNYAFSDCIGLTNITIPNSVAGIGNFAFSFCTELTSIIIPDSVTSIGSSAFYGCKIEELNIAEGSKTVTNKMVMCENTLKKVIIPNGVTSIGDFAFKGCTGLTSITIPNGVTNIGNYAFSGCTGLTGITMPDTVMDIGSYAFSDCEIKELNIAEGSKTVTSKMVVCNNTLKEVTIPTSVTSICDSAFFNCTGLKSITIPNTVTNIGGSAFSCCTRLTSITIPDSVTSIGNSAFFGCTGLTSITIPDSVTSIGENVFSDCTKIQTMVVDKNNSVFHSNGNCIIRTNDKVLIAGCENSIIPTNGSVTSIGNSAFFDCAGLRNVIIPNSIKSIGDSAFSDCTELTSIIIPDSATSIGRYAFNFCTGLTSITIPDSVAYINSYAFFGCKIKELNIAEGSKKVAKKTVVCKSTIEKVTIPDSVTSIGNHAFYDCTNLKEVHINDIVKWCNIDFNDMYSNPLYYAHNLYLNGEAVKEIVLPETVTEIKDYAFYNCAGLTKITIPESVTSIGNNAFTGCSNLVIETESDYVYEYAKLHGITVIMINNWIGSGKNPIVSVEVPDIKIIENTNGKQADGYYYYNSFLLKCIANYKDGEKKYDYAHIEYGELEKQQTEHWTAGNTYSIKVEYDGIHTTVNVTVIENPIEKIDIPDVVLEDGFIEANLYEHPQYTVTLKNGTVVESDDGAAYSNYVLIEDKEYELEINLDSEYIESLKAGDRCKIECELAGIKASYYVNIVNSPFKAIYIDDVVSERDDSGYNYAPRSGIVELINGEKIKFFGTELTFNGKYYSIGYNYQYNTPFTPGNTYEITATLGNLSTTYKVKVLKSQEQPVITNYEMTKKPTKTEYIVGEVPDWRGAVIRLSFSDGSFEDLSVPESLWPDDDGYIKLFSNKLSKYIVFFPVFESWDHWINSTDISNIKLGVWGSDKLPTPVVVAECPVTVKKNEWENIKITDYYTLNSKMTVTDKYGNTSVFNIRGLASYGGWGGGDPWLYNSQELHGMVLYTDKGLFWIDLYCWVNGKDKFFNIYINNKKLKSNTICGSPFDNIPEKLDRLCNNIFYENNNDYSMLSFSKYGEIRKINGKYYFEKEFVYRDGTCKIMYMSLDSNFEMVDYIFGFCKGYFDGNDNHEWGEWTVTKPASCTVNGEEQRSCLKCGNAEKRIVRAYGHRLKYTEEKKPTCTEKGHTAYETCQNEGCGYTDYIEIPPTGHIFGKITVVRPKYGESGYSAHKCTVCGYEEKFDITAPIEYPADKTLVYTDGKWIYLSSGKPDTDYTGLTRYNGTLLYVENGVYNRNFIGFAEYNGEVLYVENGIAKRNYTGLKQYDGNLCYIEDGVLNRNYTGLMYYYGTWFYIENGVFNRDYNGLVEYRGRMYYADNGIFFPGRSRLYKRYR